MTETGDTFELEPTPVAPNLPGQVYVRPDKDAVIDALAANLLLHAHNCVRSFGDFHLALSGGSTPIALYERLMIDPNYRDLPWQKTHLWIVDERRVPFDDERSNFRVINEIVGDHSGIPRANLHPIVAEADDADTKYEQELHQTLSRREPGQDRLDFALLGMGADGHTASLFPNSPALLAEVDPATVSAADGGKNAPHRMVRINAGPNVTPPDRVTMTLRLLNATRFVAFMVTGEGKREPIARVQAVELAKTSGTRPPETVADLPACGIEPVAGALHWYLDADACPAD